MNHGEHGGEEAGNVPDFKSLPADLFSLRVFRRWVLAVLFLSQGLSLRAADPVEFGVGGFTFERPEGWKWVVPSSPMRKAQLNVPGPTEAEVTFFHFGAGQGGGVSQNVERWLAQFQGTPDGKQREETIGNTRVVFVQTTGTFQSGMPGTPTTPKPDYALRGAILEHPDGDVYVKMTGPASTVQSAESAFFQMIKSAAGR